ncbi:MAG: DNA-protecting protein DprA [Sphaerochaetaceae bacterium]|nr:DNA-protecting protein DprA [Sphaerochaetaceae bacterium]
MDLTELKRRIVTGLLPGVDAVKKKELIQSNLSLKQILKLLRIEHPDYGAASRVIDWLEKTENSGIIWFTDPDFPPLYELDKHCPYMLFYQGKRPENIIRRVTIVGSRRADYLGLQKSFMLGLEASVNGLSVVTGVAEGCDQASCAGALSAYTVQNTQFAPPLLVLPNGFDIEYPRGSAYYRNLSLDCGGCIISCFTPGTPALRYNFIFRNMILASLSEMTLVIQSPSHSGALMTADFALQLGRDVCVSVGGIGDKMCRRGTGRLAEDGAQVINSYSDYALNGIDSSFDILQVSRQSPYQARYGDRFYKIVPKT